MTESNLDIFARVNAWAGRYRPNLIHAFVTLNGFKPNVACPQRFTEKILWRKIFDHNPAFGLLCDKLRARDFMIGRWPGLHTARTIWIGEEAAAIPQAALEGGVMVKVNHGSGQNILLREPPADRAAMEARLETWLAHDYGRTHAEWGYTIVERKIFVEELLPSSPDDPLVDYNVFCCDGQVVCYTVTIGEKTENEAIATFRPDGERDYEIERLPNYKKKFLPRDYRLPALANEAMAAAAAISRGFDFVRVDFMEAGGRLYACETTLYPGAGYGALSRVGFGRRVGDLWDLRKSWFLTAPQIPIAAPYARALREWLDAAPP